MTVHSVTSSPGPRPAILEHLKRETAGLHARVEQEVDLMGRCSTIDGYRGLLARLLELYAPLEDSLGRLDWASAGLDFEERRKVGLLRADLAALGGSPPRCAQGSPALPELGALPAGFGCLYVLEGSTLGGQLILRHVSRTLGLGSSSGAMFFASYGPRVGVMWQAFGRAAGAFCASSAQVEDAVRAAVATFESFEAWLGQPASAPRSAVGAS